MEPTPGPTAAFDLNQALLQSREQARAQWAEGLAQFQSQMATIADSSMQEVVQAAAPAFALGFSFSAQKLINEEHEVLRVTLRHRGGAEEFSEAQAPQEGSAAWHALTASLLAGLLGNVGYKLEDEEVYLGARGIKFHRHPGAHLSKKPGRWIVVAELVETTRLFGRGIAAIEPQWLEQVGAHLLKKQLLDPHWEKKSAEVVALERATLYGLVVYNGRRTPYSRVDLHGAREIFIREALVGNQWDTKLPFLASNHKMIAKVEELEHKSRRQDVLVDDELIYAFYDQQIPADVCSGRLLENWYRDESARQPRL
jgi:HrpA-like RNA helicase